MTTTVLFGLVNTFVFFRVSENFASWEAPAVTSLLSEKRQVNFL